MYGEKFLDITVFRAIKLEDVDKFGGNDPYVFVFTDIDEPKIGAKTHVSKEGKNPKWNQQLHLENLTDRTQYVYLEVMDDETGTDEPIAFAAVPLSQIRDAPGDRLQGEFNLFNKDGQAKGKIVLGLRLRNPSDLPIEEEEGALVEGVSQVVGKHQERFKKMVFKENLEDGGKAVLTGLALLGAGAKLFAKPQKKEA
ncbi:hypothetical protein DFQ26_000399 [Actinomortierella ambigua]|nr:hypothetical protein DFQ26_000399 [Actinomortierella ambigua]